MDDKAYQIFIMKIQMCLRDGGEAEFIFYFRYYHLWLFAWTQAYGMCGGQNASW